MTGEHPDAEELKEILDVVSKKIPALLDSLTDILYGKEQAKKYGEAVAGFYQSLKSAGMTDEQAFELTQQYMSSLNLPGMIGKAFSGKGGSLFEGGEDEFEEEIERRIKERIKEKFKEKIEED